MRNSREKSSDLFRRDSVNCDHNYLLMIPGK